MSTDDLERMRRFGAYEERERIVKLLEDRTAYWDKHRPESWKKAADFADLRIRTLRWVINQIKEEQEIEMELE